MEKIKKPYIDWTATADNLKLLRCDNLQLRKYVCYMLGTAHGHCSGDCEACKRDMDMHISQKELANVFGVSEHMIINWETGRSKPRLEYLIMYSKICDVKFDDVIVLANTKRPAREKDCSRDLI